MESKEIATIFEQHKNQEIISLIGKVLNDKYGDDSTVQQLMKQIKSDDSTYQSQVRQQLTQDQKKIDWDTETKTLLNRNDVELIWDKIDNATYKINKDDMYKVFGKHSGEHIVGLKKTLTSQQIKKLVDDNKANAIAFQSMAPNKRRKTSDEMRCIQQYNGQIQWYDTLKAIKKFCITNCYTKEMTQDCVFDIARQKYPDFDPFFQTLNLQALLNHLIGRDPIMFKEEVFLKPLKSLV